LSNFDARFPRKHTGSLYIGGMQVSLDAALALRVIHPDWHCFFRYTTNRPTT